MQIRYCKQIWQNPHFRLKNFSTLIKKGVEVGLPCEYNTPLTLGGIEYFASFYPKEMKLKLLWEEDGKEQTQKIQIETRKSNLSPTSGADVYYFVCPTTKKLVRTLYKVDIVDSGCGRFVSSHVFPHLYPLQMKSKNSRETYYGEEPYRKGGKWHYRGKLTPYAKRCIRYEEQYEKSITALFAQYCGDDIKELLNK